MSIPAAAIFGFRGPVLDRQEIDFFREVNPLGFVVFERNICSPEQLRSLTRSLCDISQREDVPILIDQEGGRVSRLRTPHWRAALPAALFGDVYMEDPGKGLRAAWLNSRLIAHDLFWLGINVNCFPVLDLRVLGAHPVIGDRAFSHDPVAVSELGLAQCQGLKAGGVMPVIKHLPGHGRSMKDSHLELPVVTTSLGDLEKADFVPFRALRSQALGMTAHIVYSGVDKNEPASTSKSLISKIIRGSIGFEGLLISDDISSNMQALSGDAVVRTQSCLQAGCDVILHCDGDLKAMESLASYIPELAFESRARLARAISCKQLPDPFDVKEGLAELEALIPGK